MDEILNNLTFGEILHTTINGTNYLFIKRSVDLGITYSINQEKKTLPLSTITAALNDFNQQVNINAEWYLNYNRHEYETRPCNLSVLLVLLNRIES